MSKLHNVVLMASFVCSSHSLAKVPLFEGIEETKSIGPTTENIDPSAYARVIYVAAGSADASANGEKPHPFATLDAAMKVIRQGSANERTAIFVGTGTYEAVNLQMTPFVDLFGGFDRNWQRDIFANPTTLDANHAGPVALGADNARLDGFVITHGKNTTAGGAIVCEHVSPVISNNIIRDNQTVEPQNFHRDMIHQHGADGGAISLTTGTKAEVRGNLICHNSTGIGNGGGIWIANESAPRIAQNVICDNHTGLTGPAGHDGTRSSNGGGIAVSFSCHPEIVANVVALNSVADNSDAGGVYLEYDAQAHIKGNTIAGNFGMDDGGGMYVMKLSQPLVERNIFAGNLNTSGASSQIRLSKEGRMIAMNNLFISPSSAMDVVGSWLILKNNTFVCATGVAMVWDCESPHYSSPQITSNILVGQTQPQVFAKPNQPVKAHIAHNLAPGGSQPGENNIDASPAFLDDSAKGTIASRQFDKTRYLTALDISGASMNPNDLAGRVINVGKQWSVIQSNDTHQIKVWGNITDAAMEFAVPGSYQLPDNSPHRDCGAYSVATKEK
jgi:hypothetical protein